MDCRCCKFSDAVNGGFVVAGCTLEGFVTKSDVALVAVGAVLIVAPVFTWRLLARGLPLEVEEPL